MDLNEMVNIMRGGIWHVFMLTAPVLGAALIVGLIVAIFQATTSIQEQTLTFLPKLFVILGVLALLAPWMFETLEGYTKDLFKMIPKIVGVVIQTAS